MKKTWDFDRAVSVLNEEIALLKEISAAQDIVRRAVLDREWADFDEKIEEVERLSGKFALLEDERVLIFSVLQDDPEVKRPFYTMMKRLPPDERRELSALYRELKIQTLKMKALNETFLTYLNEARNLATAFLSAVCPARGGKLYTRRGRTVSPDLRSLVFNNRF